MKPLETAPIAVITGGGSGIGRGIAATLYQAGCRVVVLDVDVASARSTCQTLGPTCVALQCDVSQRPSVEAAFDRVAEEVGPVEVLVNNAGISIDRALRHVTDDEWRRTLDINLTSAMLCTQVATRVMVPRRTGRIVNISSRSWLGWFGQSSYAASKGGMVSLTRANAVELGKYGVTVNCVAPGLIDTPLLRAEPRAVMSKLLRAQPSGTMGRPEDVGRAVEFLALDAGTSVTGQVLYVCGGKSVFAQPAL